MTNRAAFLDRDGVLIELVKEPDTGHFEGPLERDAVRLVPRAAQAALKLANAGFLLVGVTNQPGAAKLQTSITAIRSVQARVVDLLKDEGVVFADWRICLHHPQGDHPILGVSCSCRKPAPGMLLSAATYLDIDLQSSWMIGDSDSDVHAGQLAGCRTVLLEPSRSAHKRLNDGEPDYRAPDLAAAVEMLLCETPD